MKPLSIIHTLFIPYLSIIFSGGYFTNVTFKNGNRTSSKEGLTIFNFRDLIKKIFKGVNYQEIGIKHEKPLSLLSYNCQNFSSYAKNKTG
jgi:hypothetical protein